MFSLFARAQGCHHLFRTCQKSSTTARKNIDLMPRSPSAPTAAYGGLIYGKRRFNYAKEEGYNLCQKQNEKKYCIIKPSFSINQSAISSGWNRGRSGHKVYYERQTTCLTKKEETMAAITENGEFSAKSNSCSGSLVVIF